MMMMIINLNILYIIFEFNLFLYIYDNGWFVEMIQQQIGGGLGSRMEEIPKIMGHNKNKNNNSNEGGMMNYCSSEGMVERRGRGQREQNVNCPRCQSGNTKFCYYNNYSLSQPRYFCKTCRRYWTQGGSLRNVPVGGGSRKNKRSSSILASSSSSPSPSSSSVPSNKLIPDLNPNPNPNPPPCSSFVSHQNPNNKFLQGGGQDLNLAFPIQGIFHPNLDQQHQILPKFEAPTSNNSDNHHDPLTVNVNVNNNIASTSTSSCTTSASSSSAPLSALELLRTGIATRGSLNTFVPMPMPMPMPMPHSNTLYPSSGFPSLHHPNHNHNHNMATLFPPPDDDPHQQHGIHDHHNIGGGAARLFFPFADMNKIASSTTSPSDHHHHHHHHPISDQTKGVNDHHPHHQASTGYWTGLLGGGNW